MACAYPSNLGQMLRHVPTQARSRARLRTILDAADAVLAREGAGPFTSARVAAAARVPVGSVYHYFPDKHAVIEALALRYWSDFQDLVTAVAETAERDPMTDPISSVLDALVAGFRAHPGFLALWYGGLRTERVREITRPTRGAIAASVARILAVHWPSADDQLRHDTAGMAVLAGDGLLREAFRASREGDEWLLAESRAMLHAYIALRLGDPER